MSTFRDLLDNLKFWFFCGLLRAVLSNGKKEEDVLVMFSTLVDVLVDWHFIEDDSEASAFAISFDELVQPYLAFCSQGDYPDYAEVMTTEQISQRLATE